MCRPVDRLSILLLFFLNLNSCAAQQEQPVFYQGLLARAESAAGEGDAAAKALKEAAAFFETALNSSNVYIRQAAAEELLSLLYEGEELPGPVLNRAWQESAGSWAAAFETLDADGAPIKEKALSFLLGSGDTAAGPGTVFPNEAVFYLLRECRNRDANFFSPAEMAAIEGHIAASDSRFSAALALFRIVLNDNASIFLQYPGLLNDLGRCFQYATIGIEGLELFLKWEKNLAEGPGPGPEINSTVRFRLLFFAARIARQRGLVDQGISLFIRTLPFAPAPDQADACIWYILDSALNGGSAAAIRQLESLVSQWHDDAYFFDVLDRLSRELIIRRQWKELIQVFALIKNHSTASTAKYAYIIGRAIEEGYLSLEETRLAAEAVDAAADKAALVKTYLRIAYDTGSASFYYRAQSAAALGESFLELSAPAAGARRPVPRGADLPEFLLGFFSNGAADFALRYIKSMEKDLSTAELYTLAGALADAGLYAESMRLVSVYLERGGHDAERRDLALLYPRPFKDLVEQFAEKTGLPPALLFGLIRTESAFQSGIVSRAGAVGLTQLMPATAEEMAGRIRRQNGPDYTRPGEADNAGPDLQDPAINIHIGAVYLDYLMERTENTLLALLAYNGGMNRVRRWQAADSQRPGGGFPVDLFLETIEYPETREYGRRVLAAAAVYEYLYYETGS